MELLYWFESIRNPVLTTLAEWATFLGEDSVFLVIALLFFWCSNKRNGYYLLSIGLLGTIMNQALKIIYRIPRPWVQDPNFTIVESARAGAGGYSFPSGHTQSTTTTFWGIARTTRHRLFQILFPILSIAVGLSRMYLGVHTPLDVGVSFVLGLVMVFVCYPLFHQKSGKGDRAAIMLGVAALASVAYLAFATFVPFPADVDAENLFHARESAWKLAFASVMVFVGYLLDTKYIRFDTKAVWWAQLLKAAIGCAGIFAIQTLLKSPLQALFAFYPLIGDGLRYGLMVLFALILWPMTFKWFSRLGQKN